MSKLVPSPDGFTQVDPGNTENFSIIETHVGGHLDRI